MCASVASTVRNSASSTRKNCWKRAADAEMVSTCARSSALLTIKRTASALMSSTVHKLPAYHTMSRVRIRGRGGADAGLMWERSFASTHPRTSETIARTAHRFQQRFVVRLVNFATQPCDVHVNDVAGGIEVVVPRVLTDPFPRDHVAGAAHQDLQHREFLGRELDFPR